MNSSAHVRCPYDDCTFVGTADEVDDHVSYLIWVGDEEHAESELKR